MEEYFTDNELTPIELTVLYYNAVAVVIIAVNPYP
jgi:hypothetical protein